MSISIRNHRLSNLNFKDDDGAFGVDDGFRSSSTPSVFFYDIELLFSRSYDDIRRYCEGVVPQYEIAKNHFRNHEDRCRYLLSRYCLRKLASKLIGIPPVGIPIRPGEFGKPYINLADNPLSFNLSHSNSIVAIALHRTTVGIDVEKNRSVRDAGEIIEEYFTRSERYWYAQQGRQDSAFLTLWTRKESYFKALGAGLSIPLQSISLCPGNDSLGRWKIQSLPSPPGYVAALSYKRT